MGNSMMTTFSANSFWSREKMPWSSLASATAPAPARGELLPFHRSFQGTLAAMIVNSLSRIPVGPKWSQLMPCSSR